MRDFMTADGVESRDSGSWLPDLLRIRPIGIDDWSNVRYVHGSAFRSILGPHLTPETISAFLAALDDPGYVDRLRDCDLIGVWLDGELVGTAGWRRGDDRAAVATIEGLFVRPMFAFMGIGSALLAHAESRARDAGCVAFTATVAPVSVPFMLRFGYDIAAHGADLPEAPFEEPMFLMRKREGAAMREPIVADDSVDADNHDTDAVAVGTSRPRVLLFGK